MIAGYAGARTAVQRLGVCVLPRLSLAQVRLRYVVARPLDQMTEAALKADSRAGAKTILEAVRRRRFENRLAAAQGDCQHRYAWWALNELPGGGLGAERRRRSAGSAPEVRTRRA